MMASAVTSAEWFNGHADGLVWRGIPDWVPSTLDQPSVDYLISDTVRCYPLESNQLLSTTLSAQSILRVVVDSAAAKEAVIDSVMPRFPQLVFQISVVPGSQCFVIDRDGCHHTPTLANFRAIAFGWPVAATELPSPFGTISGSSAPLELTTATSPTPVTTGLQTSLVMGKKSLDRDWVQAFVANNLGNKPPLVSIKFISAISSSDAIVLEFMRILGTQFITNRDPEIKTNRNGSAVQTFLEMPIILDNLYGWEQKPAQEMALNLELDGIASFGMATDLLGQLIPYSFLIINIKPGRCNAIVDDGQRLPLTIDSIIKVATRKNLRINPFAYFSYCKSSTMLTGATVQ